MSGLLTLHYANEGPNESVSLTRPSFLYIYKREGLKRLKLGKICDICLQILNPEWNQNMLKVHDKKEEERISGNLKFGDIFKEADGNNMWMRLGMCSSSTKVDSRTDQKLFFRSQSIGKIGDKLPNSLLK